MKLLLILFVLFFVIFVESKKHKWKKLKKTKEKLHKDSDGKSKTHHRLKFHTDALPYSSPYARPYKWNMYTDGPYGWGPAKKRRDIDSFGKFKRGLYQQNIIRPFAQPAQQTASYYQPATHPYQPAVQPYNYQVPQARTFIEQSRQPAQPYNYQPAIQPYQAAPQNRATLGQPAQPYQYQPYNYQATAQNRASLTPTRHAMPYLQKQAPKEERAKERTWVDNMGVTWTTRKVNDYKWGEREPGIMMDQYAGGPFGFDDVKRNQILPHPQYTQWQRRSSIPRPRSWIDKLGVKWTSDKVNDYKWGEREPGVIMDQYNGGPYGWVKRSKIIARPASIPHQSLKKYMFTDKP